MIESFPPRIARLPGVICRCVLAALFVAGCGNQLPEAETSRPANPDDVENRLIERHNQELAPRVFWIGKEDPPRIYYRVLDTVNAVRAKHGVSEVEFSKELNAAAVTHSRDMFVQNRPWHFGSDGSSPIDRAERAGYGGRVLGENIAESFESDIESLGAWLARYDTRTVILDPDAQLIGIGWHQEEEGKIWWTLIVGT